MTAPPHPVTTATATTLPTAQEEQAAFTHAMNALLHPKRIAVVGATPRPGFANNIHRSILNGGYAGEVFGVTPRHQNVLGSVCYPTIDAIPGGVDKAIVVVPSELVLDVLGQAERAGVTAVNIITSGFGEQSDDDAHQRQEEIRAFAQRTGIRVVGPNCLGIISTPAKMIAKSGASILPIHFTGQNSRAYQIANKLAATLRQGLLLYEIRRALFKPQRPYVGEPIPASELDKWKGNPRGFLAWLRDHTLSLGR